MAAKKSKGGKPATKSGKGKDMKGMKGMINGKRGMCS